MRSTCEEPCALDSRVKVVVVALTAGEDPNWLGTRCQAESMALGRVVLPIVSLCESPHGLAKIQFLIQEIWA